MTNSVKFRFMAAIVAIAVMVFCLGCNKDNDKNSGGSGLTIVGLPSGPAYDIELFESGTTLNTEIDRLLAMTGGKFLARGGVPKGGGNVFHLYKGHTMEKWKASGANLIILLSESTLEMDFVNPRKATITINNGTGEINFSAFNLFGQ